MKNLQQENVELKDENKALKETVTQLLKEIERLRETKVEDYLDVDKSLPFEEQIVLKQIKYFMATSIERALTLDETRALDLLIKNKRAFDEKKPKVNEDEVPEGTTDADLLRIVSNGENQKVKKARKRSKS